MTIVVLCQAQAMATLDAASETRVEIDGPAAALIDLNLPRTSEVTMKLAFYWSGLERESGQFVAGFGEDSSAFYSAAYTSQTMVGEAHYQIGSVSGAVVPAIKDSGGPSTYRWLLPAGRWQVVLLGNASQPVTRTVFELDVDDPEASWTWTISRHTEFLTVRNMEAEAKLFARTAAGGISVVRGGQHVTSTEHRLLGYSLYLPGQPEDHQFTLTTPPGDVLPADDLLFLGWPAGDYRFSLEQASATPFWPSRMVVLTADLPLGD